MAALTYYKKLIVKLKAIQTDEDLQAYIKKIEGKIADMESRPYEANKEVFDWFVRFIRIRSENKKLIAEKELLRKEVENLRNQIENEKFCKEY